MKIRPLGNRILVKRLDADKTSLGGIIIPGNAQGKSNQGLVREVGPGLRVEGERIGMDVAVGDVIMFGKYSGNEVDVDGEALLLMVEDDVLAVVLSED